MTSIKFDIIKKLLKKRSLNIYFCIKNDKEISPIHYKVQSDAENSIKEIVYSALGQIEKLDTKPYNPVGSLDKTIEFTNTKEFECVKILINSLKTPAYSDDLESEKINFLIYEFIPKDDENDGNENIYKDKNFYFIRKHIKLQVFKKGFMGSIFNNSFKKIENTNLIGIDSYIDLIICDNEIVVVNHSSFERIFDLHKTFEDAAIKVLNNPKLKANIENFNELENGILSNLSYVKRVSKLLEKPNSLIFLDKIEKTKKVISDFNLDIKINDENKIVYRDKTQLGDFINLMQDAYYKTIIGEEKGTDERR